MCKITKGSCSLLPRFIKSKIIRFIKFNNFIKSRFVKSDFFQTHFRKTKISSVDGEEIGDVMEFLVISLFNYYMHHTKMNSFKAIQLLSLPGWF